MLPIKTILHPTDFSERSEFAFQLACSLAHDYGARLVLVHVVESPMAYGGDAVVALPYVMDVEPIRHRLQHLRAPDPNVQIEHRLLEGDAPSEILWIAEETKCDLVVLGTHGRTGLGRLLMGSVAEEIVRKAPCPVLTVRGALPALLPEKESRTKAAKEPELAAL